jgi:DNA-binding NtrC family response regulator
VPVLLRGPRGAGKTLAAQVIHRHGRRSAGPLVTFRADEWPEAEREGALQQAMDSAREGSLLVEEIGFLSLPLQALLARLLSAEEPQPRVLATTSSSLADAICAGSFREDLFYQLAVLQVVLPRWPPILQDVQRLDGSCCWLLRRWPA